MARKYKSTERFLLPDARHDSMLATKFIHCLMQGGKKSTAQSIFYDALGVIATKVKETEPIEVFNQALGNVRPLVEVRSKRVGGATYQVPREVPKKRQVALSMRWIIEGVRSKKGRPAHLKLADELIAAFRKEGAAIAKRENTHRMAEANKAFAHFSW
ncbi:MAG: 30S ribosomal protein S7 [Planctomycetota bacterium]|nr:30S ribosomal protein S7 [Planctomycetota bacterium]